MDLQYWTEQSAVTALREIAQIQKKEIRLIQYLRHMEEACALDFLLSHCGYGVAPVFQENSRGKSGGQTE